MARRRCTWRPCTSSPGSRTCCNLPLHAAAESGHLELARLLLPLTADPDVKNRDGQSAADYARSRGYTRIDKLLKGGD